MPNLIPAPSAYFELDLGDWVPWWGATVAWSASDTADNSAGCMVVTLTAADSWAVQTNNHPGWACRPLAGSTWNASFKVKTTGSFLPVFFEIQWWHKGDATYMDYSSITGDAGTSDYALIAATGAVPTGGVDHIWCPIYANAGGSIGDVLRIDDLYVDVELEGVGRRLTPYYLGR